MGKPINLDYQKAIYGLKSTDGQIMYVGHCTYAAERMALHRQRAREGKHLHINLYQWIEQVGLDTVKIEVLEKFNTKDIETIEAAERKWIKHFRDQGVNLTNMTIGGTVSGKDHPMYGKSISAEHKALMWAARDEARANRTQEEHEEIVRKARETWLKNTTPEQREAYARNQREKNLKWEKAQTPGTVAFIKSKGPHSRYHAARNQPNPKCPHCINENLV